MDRWKHRVYTRFCNLILSVCTLLILRDLGQIVRTRLSKVETGGKKLTASLHNTSRAILLLAFSTFNWFYFENLLEQSFD